MTGDGRRRREGRGGEGEGLFEAEENKEGREGGH